MGIKSLGERFPYLNPLDKLALFVFAPRAFKKDSLLVRISFKNGQILPEILPILSEEEKEELKRIISSSLSSRERFIILSHFGIEREPLTLEEIGEKLQVSRQRVSEIEKRALWKIRKAWKGKISIFLYEKVKKMEKENQKMREVLLNLGKVIFSEKEEKEMIEEIKKILLPFFVSFFEELFNQDFEVLEEPQKQFFYPNEAELRKVEETLTKSFSR